MKKSITRGIAAQRPRVIPVAQFSAGQISTTHERPVAVGPNSVGTGKGCQSTVKEFAMIVKKTTTRGTAKSETSSRIFLVAYLNVLTFARSRPVRSVPAVSRNWCVGENSTWVFVNLSTMLPIPIEMKITETKQPKASCVNREQYRIAAQPSAAAMMIM